MAEILSPGVFVEEIPSQVQVIQAVSTSNLGGLGFTQRGPENTATLVTSFDDFTRTFGPIISDSYLPLSMAAFFANGGRRAFIVRVVPSDAVAADALIDSQTTDQLIETGDGAAVAFTKTSTTSLLKDNAGASPLVASSVSFRWRATGTPVVAEDLRNRGNTADVAQVNGTAAYEFRINPASLPTFDAELHSIVPGTVSLIWDPDGAGVRTIVIPAPSSGFVTTTTANGQGSVVTFDHRSGRGSVLFAGTDVPDAAFVGDLTLSFTPATATRTITDDGLGAFPAGTVLTAPGTISYADGAYSFTTVAGSTPHDDARILATYRINAWDLNPISKGTWANDMKVVVSGDIDFYTASTAQYSKFKVNVLLLNTATNNYDIVETFEQISFSDSSDGQFFPDVINELSDYVSVEEPGGDEAPGQLNGIARTEIMGGGDEATGGRVFSHTLNKLTIAPRTVTITYTDTTATVRTVTDDGLGNLIGSIDPAADNTINYTTGVITLTVLNSIDATTLVTVTYSQAGSETTHEEAFSGGTDGTFTSSTYGRDQFTSPTLSSSYQGIFALDRVEELMQVIVPDFVGDSTITGDILDYVDGRATQPSGGDRFAILQPPVGSSAQEAVDWLRYTLGRYSKFAAVYWPHLKVADPLANGRPKLMPAVGHIAGIYARTDATKNVGKAPGGTVDGALRFLTGLELTPTQGERDLVSQNKINSLISSPQTGIAVWGVRTISSESEWRYINVRRLFMFLEKSVFNATHWIVFENNGPVLWAKIKAQLTGFLTNLFNDGLFAGSSPAEAFFVICDESNNSAESIAAGQVIIDIGVAPNTPAEFVRFRFQQLTLG